MLNGKFLNDQAAEFAKRLRKEAGDKLEGTAKVEAQVTLAYRLALGHEPDKALVERGLKLIDALQKKHNQSRDESLKGFCLMVLNLNEFVYLD